VEWFSRVLAESFYAVILLAMIGAWVGVLVGQWKAGHRFRTVLLAAAPVVLFYWELTDGQSMHMPFDVEVRMQFYPHHWNAPRPTPELPPD
jgi:hypothetical protein